MDSALKGLQPASLWEHFDQIRQIPHESGNEEAIRQYVLSVAEWKGLEAEVDEVGNVLVRVPGSAGHESAPTVVLQGHLDMVCEKNSDVDFDFARDPIGLTRDGDWLKARGTTLGADNGIGVAAALACAEETDLVHGPLELLFTIEEETGLTGAAGIQAGFVQGKYLLNLDSEEMGALTIGCAGGGDIVGRFGLSWEPVPSDWLGFEIGITGLLGGHSGLDINKGRGNAIRILADLLMRILKDTPDLKLAAFEGGNKRNAIPREAGVVLAIGPDHEALLRKHVKQATADALAETGRTDPGLGLVVNKIDTPKQAFTQAHTLLRLIVGLPSGVLAMSQEVAGLVETSNNMGVVRLNEKEGTVVCAPRSSIGASLHRTANALCCLFELANGAGSIEGLYPGWAPNPDSHLVAVMKTVYHERFGGELVVEACHAGLECGIIGERHDKMQMVSFGPTIEAPHSPDERVNVHSVGEFWKLLTDALAALAA